MENSDSIWQWCKARKKLFTMSKIQSMADGFSSVSKIGSLEDGFSPNIIRKGNQCIEDSLLRRSSATFEGKPLKSRAYCRDICLPVQSSFAEVGPFENGDSVKSSISVIPHHVSSSETNSDTMSNHPHSDSGLDGQFLPRLLGIADENSVEDLAFFEKKQPSKSRVWRRGQKAAVKQNFSDEGMNGSSVQYATCSREPLVEASSSSSISKAIEGDMELQSPSMNGEMRNLSSDYIDWPCHPPATKKPKKDQGWVSETSKSPFQIENQKAKSEFLFPGLHLLAGVAVRCLENDQSRFPENITQKKRMRKAIFPPTGLPFLQNRVVRRTKIALKHHQPDSPQLLHDLQKNLSAANSKRLLTADNICRLGDPACIKPSQNQVVGNGVDEDQLSIPQLRCSKRSRSHGLPSKYCDSVLQPWKRGTRG